MSNRKAWDLIEAWLVKYGLQEHAGTIAHEDLANQITLALADPDDRIKALEATLAEIFRIAEDHREWAITGRCVTALGPDALRSPPNESNSEETP